MARLLWFNHHFTKADVIEGELQLSDLRMGMAPDYAFTFAVARREGAAWRAIPPVDANRRQARQALRLLWQRMHGEKPTGSAADAPN